MARFSESYWSLSESSWNKNGPAPTKKCELGCSRNGAEMSTQVRVRECSFEPLTELTLALTVPKPTSPHSQIEANVVSARLAPRRGAMPKSVDENCVSVPFESSPVPLE